MQLQQIQRIPICMYTRPDIIFVDAYNGRVPVPHLCNICMCRAHVIATQIPQIMSQLLEPSLAAQLHGDLAAAVSQQPPYANEHGPHECAHQHCPPQISCACTGSHVHRVPCNRRRHLPHAAWKQSNPVRKFIHTGWCGLACCKIFLFFENPVLLS